ncbi:MAG: PKD domain-containing protein [Candidatus Gracilibacteria bacterium]|nr:PKD domain-containing protein [Candidatus Gracilibacteria bacterium]
MLKKIILTFFVLITSLYSQTVFGAYSIPVQDVFSDINSNYKYLNELQTLYDKGMIFPDKNGKFNPNELLNRDEFVGILGEVTCKKCIQPNTSYDLVNKYENKLVFYDINQSNKYFYCIADSTNNSFLSGYHQGSKCEDGTIKIGEKPFCPNNTIVLEEALSIILKASGILSNKEADQIRQNIINGKITKKLSTDVSPKNIDGSVYSFYPDFQKALEYEIIDVDKNGSIKKYKLLELTDGKIRPKQTISKEEFLRIAFVALKANSCSQKSDNKLPIDIIVYNKSCDSNKTNCKYSDLNDLDNTYDFTLNTITKCDKGINEPDGYIWRFYNNSTGEEIKKYGKYIDNHKFLYSGEWKIFLRVIDSCGNTSEIYNTFFVNNGKIPSDSNINNNSNKYNLQSDIIASKITGEGPLLIDYSGIVSGGEGPYSYFWDFGDGNSGYGKDTSNLYKQLGIYNLKLIVTDKNGIFTSSTLSVNVTSISNKIIDSDNDGVFDDKDLCPLIAGSKDNKGCPILEEKCNNSIKCREGTFCNSNNICEANILSSSCEYSGGNAIFGNAICNSCPCDYRLDFVSTLRKCDLIFPAIVSPDNRNIYNRGQFYQIK